MRSQGTKTTLLNLESGKSAIYEEIPSSSSEDSTQTETKGRNGVYHQCAIRTKVLDKTIDLQYKIKPKYRHWPESFIHIRFH